MLPSGQAIGRPPTVQMKVYELSGDCDRVVFDWQLGASGDAELGLAAPGGPGRDAGAGGVVFVAAGLAATGWRAGAATATDAGAGAGDEDAPAGPPAWMGDTLVRAAPGDPRRCGRIANSPTIPNENTTRLSANNQAMLRCRTSSIIAPPDERRGGVFCVARQ